MRQIHNKKRIVSYLFTMLILVLYLGENEELLTLLNETIGEPFAG